MSELVLICENPMNSIPADTVLKKTLLDLQKRFPIYHARVPNYLAAHFRCSLFPEIGLAFHQDLESGKTKVDCVLIQHLENLLNNSYNSFHSVVPESWP